MHSAQLPGQRRAIKRLFVDCATRETCNKVCEKQHN
jgi:hypothetical protein